jgi:transposase
MPRKKDAASLDPWIDDAKNSLIAFFVRGAMEDKAAVRADIDSPWCQSASKIDPRSAFKIDPLFGRSAQR